jgi:hypothetical protein
VDTYPETKTKDTHKLRQALNVQIRVSLEPFMLWGRGTDGQFPASFLAGDAVLDWPDIEVNTSRRWMLPILRRSFPQQQVDPIETTGALTKKGDRNKSDQQITQKSRLQTFFRK